MIISLLNTFDFHNPAILKAEGAASVVYYFTVYSFIGWLLENSYSFFTKQVFYKPNFFRGPFKPMYGIAPVLLVYLIRPETSWMVVILLCFFIPTFVEYVSGFMLQKLFHQQWWDYSDMPLQLQGHICLPFALCWILLSIICLKWIHPIIVSGYGVIEFYWTRIYLVVILYFLAELFIAIRRHSSKRLFAEKPTNTIQ